MAPRKLWPHVPPEDQMQLRSKRSAAPGSPDKPRPKKTSAQVTKEKSEKEQAKRTAEKKQRATRQAVLEKEKEMRQQTVEADRAADHPPQNGTKKVTRPDVRDNAGDKAAENENEMKKGFGQASKDVVSRRLTRQDTTEVPETEGEHFIFQTSGQSDQVLF